jgi:hypothetical protein
LLLAAFCWTKSLLCNDAFYQGFSYFQSLHFRDLLLEDSAQIPSQRNRIPCIRLDDVVISSGRSAVKASSVWTTRTFRPNLPLCREASNCSKLHPSRRFSNTAEHLQCSTSQKISFQNTGMGRQLQLSERCVFPSARYP